MTDADPHERASGPGPTSRDHPDVLAVCRWLPQPYPWGAFTGRHDYIHVGPRQGRANLWWADQCVHRGDYVGPPRGGLVPDHYPDYDVAMPSGGFLQVRSGVLADWADNPATSRVLRADGETFSPQEYGPGHPYWLHDYRAMTPEDQRNALAGVRHSRDSTRSDDTVAGAELLSAITDRVRSAQMPHACSCENDGPSPARGMDIPGAVLRHSGAVATLTGTGDPATAAEVVWSLTRELADPDRAGLVRAAEAAARRSADTMAGWPDGPLTEEAVALVAAQALRWHGGRVVGDLPFWVIGWIFIAQPVFESLLPDRSATENARLRRAILRHADEVRVDRVARTWEATHRADRMLRAVADLADSPEPMTPAEAVIDLRTTAEPRPVVPQPRDSPPPAYERSIAAVVADLAAG